MVKSCSTCKHFEPSDAAHNDGFCHRYPPSPTHRTVETNVNEWCAEHSFKNKEDKDKK